MSSSLQILALGQPSFVGFSEEPFRASEPWLRGKINWRREQQQRQSSYFAEGSARRCCNHLPKRALHFARHNCVLLCLQKKNQPRLPKRYRLWFRMTGSAALLCSKIKEQERETLTWNLQAMMDVTHSTYRKQKEGYLHTRNSSCMTSWDGSSLSALSQSPEHPALDQIPGEKAVKAELCSSNTS